MLGRFCVDLSLKYSMAMGDEGKFQSQLLQQIPQHWDIKYTSLGWLNWNKDITEHLP